MTKKIKPRTYGKEFQMNAVSLVKRTGKSVAAVALELNVPAWKLRNWVKEAQDNQERAADLDDLNELMKENKRLKEENEILKKAAAYFAKNQA